MTPKKTRDAAIKAATTGAPLNEAVTAAYAAAGHGNSVKKQAPAPARKGRK